MGFDFLGKRFPLQVGRNLSTSGAYKIWDCFPTGSPWIATFSKVPPINQLSEGDDGKAEKKLRSSKKWSTKFAPKPTRFVTFSATAALLAFHVEPDSLCQV